MADVFIGNNSAEHLKQFIERIERLNEEKQTIAEDIKEVFSEAKGSGFDAGIMREIIKSKIFTSILGPAFASAISIFYYVYAIV